MPFLNWSKVEFSHAAAYTNLFILRMLLDRFKTMPMQGVPGASIVYIYIYMFVSSEKTNGFGGFLINCFVAFKG